MRSSAWHHHLLLSPAAAAEVSPPTARLVSLWPDSAAPGTGSWSRIPPVRQLLPQAPLCPNLAAYATCAVPWVFSSAVVLHRLLVRRRKLSSRIQKDSGYDICLT